MTREQQKWIKTPNAEIVRKSTQATRAQNTSNIRSKQCRFSQKDYVFLAQYRKHDSLLNAMRGFGATLQVSTEKPFKRIASHTAMPNAVMESILSK